MAFRYNSGLNFHRSASLCAAGWLLSVGCGVAQTAHPSTISPGAQKALNTITAGELKGDLSFLASDVLAGRYTPSPGLEVAAEFIASKFRAAGLEPGGTSDYFQMAEMLDRRMPRVESGLQLESGSQMIDIPAGSVQIYQASEAARIDRAPVAAFVSPDPEALAKTEVKGKAVVHAQPEFAKMPHEQAIAEYKKMRAFSRGVSKSGALVEIVLRSDNGDVPGARLIPLAQAEQRVTPVLIATSAEALKWIHSSQVAGSKSFVTVNIPAPDDRKVSLKNVVGILRGSDPRLKDTCVLVTAHYDHIGTLETGKGMATPAKKETADRIYNGANDDGSGTVSVIEIGRALAKLNPHPKRSIVFMTFFGEERGELGSQFYGEHPVFPLAKTVADVNLEQVGRTDATTGKQINTASLTGYDYSDVTKYLESAGRLLGIKVYKDAQASDAYFTQSDNSPLAEHGVPAHSLTVAFDYPDYHGLGDEWQKIDYENMARVDRMVTLAVLNMANAATAPAWNAQNPNTERFRQAQKTERTAQ